MGTNITNHRQSTYIHSPLTKSTQKSSPIPHRVRLATHRARRHHLFAQIVCKPKVECDGQDLNQTKHDTRTRQLGGHRHEPNDTMIPMQATQVARPPCYIGPKKTLANHNVRRPGKAAQSNEVETMMLDASNNSTRRMPLKAPRKSRRSRFSSLQLGTQHQLNRS